MSNKSRTLPRPARPASLTDTRVLRPVSLYDNLQQQQQQQQQQEEQEALNGNDPWVLASNSGPSQVANLNTTVPVNLARTSLGGRHTPTRASLRHSRMLVLTQQTGRVPWRYLPRVVRRPRLATLLGVLLTLLGVLGLLMATHLTLVTSVLLHPAPHLSVCSAALCVVAGVSCAALACCCRRLPPLHPLAAPPSCTCCLAPPLAVASCLSMCALAGLLSVIACVLSGLRLVWLLQQPMSDGSCHGELPLPASPAPAAPHTTLPAAAAECSSGWCEDGCPMDHFTTTLITLIGLGLSHALAACLALAFLLQYWSGSRRPLQPIYMPAASPVLVM